MPVLVVAPGTGAVTRNLTVLEYRWRFTLAEQRAIKAAIRSHPSDDVRDTLAVLETSLDVVDPAVGVSVTDARTIDGAWYTVGVLASLGLVDNTEPGIASRVADVLAPVAE
jgi:hypothetical protein